jgi:hypothetical protein
MNTIHFTCGAADPLESSGAEGAHFCPWPTAKATHKRQSNNAGLTESFYYDNLYRLDHSMLGSNVNLQMGYDAMGDITSRSNVAGGATWTYDPVRKHAVTQAGSSSFRYAYDANGNVASRNGSIFGWTSYNYPDGVTTATESPGRRFATSSPAMTHSSIGGASVLSLSVWPVCSVGMPVNRRQR